ncbi:hypothetical protein ACLKA7_009089 [Drosophila subpalustris]
MRHVVMLRHVDSGREGKWEYGRVETGAATRLIRKCVTLTVRARTQHASTVPMGAVPHPKSSNLNAKTHCWLPCLSSPLQTADMVTTTATATATATAQHVARSLFGKFGAASQRLSQNLISKRGGHSDSDWIVAIYSRAKLATNSAHSLMLWHLIYCHQAEEQQEEQEENKTRQRGYRK